MIKLIFFPIVWYFCEYYILRLVYDVMAWEEASLTRYYFVYFLISVGTLNNNNKKIVLVFVKICYEK